MDIVTLYQDFGIDYMTAGHKHCKYGWIQIKCPFCTGNPGYHLGFNLNNEYFNCYRCGSKSIPYVLKELLGKNYSNEIYQIYGLIGAAKPKLLEEVIKKKPFKLPTGLEPLGKQHREYLLGRGFNPDKLIEDWNLKGTGNVSMLGNAFYGNRIIIPIVWNGRIVSFQGRDVTNASTIKYKACTRDREIVQHQHILYGREEYWDDWAICVEGVTDVWAMGFRSFGVFGIEFTNYQIREMVKRWKRIIVIFDGETQAQSQADKLISELRFRGVKADKIIISGDPGSKTVKEIAEIHKLLQKKLEEM